MNTIGWIFYRLPHGVLCQVQAAQLIGAYRERLPCSAVERTVLLRTLDALSNGKLARYTDWEEMEGARLERRLLAVTTDLERVTEELSLFASRGGRL